MSDKAYLELSQPTKSYPSPKGEAVIVKDVSFKFRKVVKPAALVGRVQGAVLLVDHASSAQAR